MSKKINNIMSIISKKISFFWYHNWRIRKVKNKFAYMFFPRLNFLLPKWNLLIKWYNYSVIHINQCDISLCKFDSKYQSIMKKVSYENLQIWFKFIVIHNANHNENNKCIWNITYMEFCNNKGENKE